MIDQRVSQGFRSEFFEKKAFTTTIPGQLIKKFNIPVVPIFIQRYEGLNFKMKVLIQFIFQKKINRKHNNQLNKTLESMIFKILIIGFGHIIVGNKAICLILFF